MSCPKFLVLDVLSLLSCQCCPPEVVLIRLSCPGCPVMALLSRPSCPNRLVPAVLPSNLCLQLFWRRCFVVAVIYWSILSDLSMLTCQVDLSRSTCPDWPVLVFLSQIPYLDCTATVVLFWLSCPSCPVLAVMFWPSCPLFSYPSRAVMTLFSGCPGPAFPLALLLQLSCLGYSVSAVLLKHTYSSSRIFAVLSLLSCPGCPVLSVLLRLICPGWPVWLAYLDDPFTLPCPIVTFVVMSQMPRPDCTHTVMHCYPIPKYIFPEMH
jgi:hypothetical protein